MNVRGEIIIVDDDIEDLEILQEVYDSLPYNNKLILFNSAESAYNYLEQNDARPFLIISDINMPRMNGFQLRDKVFSYTENTGRIIPFIFVSTTSDRKMI
ncbi:response regulator [Flavobacterium rakeshii]|uniref:response regulator n=1 Tax=Flavobacterium rakeshii TaxID=1038845 RepID=UPI002E7B179B|nr:response regulator [Flavobacterium rakeshii]MEE1896992.1 response regulator [Flavobacterium rakeshii]